MKVIHLTSGGDVGGAKTHVLSLLKGLNKTDTAQLVCFMEGPFAAEARQMQIPTTVIADKNVLKACKKVLALIRKGGFELVHCHGSKANMIGSLVKKKAGVPIVTTVHSDYKMDYMGRPWGNVVYGTINKLALRRMDYYTAVSDQTADQLISRRFDPQRIFPIYNGVDFPPPEPSASREDYLKSIGVRFDENTVVFGIAARLNPVKDIATLIRGFSKAAKICPNIRLLIAGTGEEETMLKQLAQELCPEGSIVFLGWLRDTDCFYHALDVNMLTSLTEAFPYVLPEGARWRCATIATRVGGIPHMITHGVNGLLFTPRDVDTLATHIQNLASDRSLRLRLSERLYEKAVREFSTEATVERQKEIYRIIFRRRDRVHSKRDGVMICGAYGRENAGDETLLATIVAQMRQIDPDISICVMTKSPLDAKTRLHINAVSIFDFPAIFHRLGKTRLFISGGGTLIQDVTSTRSLVYYLTATTLAKLRGNRVMLYGCGIGPIIRPKNRRLSSRVLNRSTDYITLRDSFSLQYLQDLQVHKPQIRLTADPAILCKAADPEQVESHLRAIGLEPEGRYALFALRSWAGFSEAVPAFAAAADYVFQTYHVTPVFLAMEPEHDLPVARRVSEYVKAPNHVICPSLDGRLTAGLVSHMQIVISMRLHGLIFAAGQNIPSVGIAYDPKVGAFMDYLHQNSYIPLQKVSEPALKRLIDNAFQVGPNAGKSVDRLRHLAEQNAQIARKLLEL